MKSFMNYIIPVITLLFIGSCDVDNVNTLFDEDKDLIFFNDALIYGPPVTYLFDGSTASIGEQVTDNLIIEIGAILKTPQSVKITPGGTAILGEDYIIQDDLTLNFPAGASVKTLAISLIDNQDFDDDSTIILSLPNGFGYADSNRRELLINVVNNDLSSGTVTVAIDGSSDDAEEGITGNSPGSMDLESSDIEFGETEGSTRGVQYIGLRYNSISIPQGATIISAKLSFVVDETVDNPQPVVMEIYGEASDNATTFTNTLFDISSRSKTSEMVAWDIPVWNTVGDSKNSVELKSIIQEIIDRPGWEFQNSLVLIFDPSEATLSNPTDSGRVAEAFDGDGGPVLVIDWEL